MQTTQTQEMLRRFVSAVVIAATVVFVGAIVLLFEPDFSTEGLYLLTTIWCIVPFVWGIWAVLAPKSWCPGRLPLWGAILGLMAGVMVIFVLDLPGQVLEVSFSFASRAGLVLIAVALYFGLWVLVRWVYLAISKE